jgi:hypothetical protein
MDGNQTERKKVSISKPKNRKPISYHSQRVEVKTNERAGAAAMPHGAKVQNQKSMQLRTLFRSAKRYATQQRRKKQKEETSEKETSAIRRRCRRSFSLVDTQSDHEEVSSAHYR